MSLELEDVERAAGRLAGVAHRTPVLTSRTLDERTGAHVHVKAECFQRGGAFKFRGAFNKISSLDEDALRRGVLAYSSGNHAQAVAIAAGLLGSHATIVMPGTRRPRSSTRTRGYGAEVVPYDRWTESREEIGARLARSAGSSSSSLRRPARDGRPGDRRTRAARGRTGARPALVPVSGGGLIAGCATAAKALRPGIRVVGVEPEAGDDTRARSPPAGAFASTSHPPSPTGCRRPSPAS
jgi:threonine dehydratase